MQITIGKRPTVNLVILKTHGWVEAIAAIKAEFDELQRRRNYAAGKNLTSDERILIIDDFAAIRATAEFNGDIVDFNEWMKDLLGQGTSVGMKLQIYSSNVLDLYEVLSEKGTKLTIDGQSVRLTSRAAMLIGAELVDNELIDHCLWQCNQCQTIFTHNDAAVPDHEECCPNCHSTDLMVGINIKIQ